MKPFLKLVVEHVKKNHANNTAKIAIVLPNRRASVFLKKYFSEVYQEAIWLPEIYSTEDFITGLSGLNMVDSITQLFEFYQVYKEIEKKNPDTFDEFSKWATILLQDFNEIDQYLISAKDLFGYVNETRAIELWNPGKPELTDHQKIYLEFWESLPLFYERYNAFLSSKNKAYQGKAFRVVATHIQQYVLDGKFDKWDKIIFAGFNAFNQAEVKIVDELLIQNKAEILWDSDSYYLNDKNQEAGIFLNKYKKKWDKHSFNWNFDFISKEEKTIHILGVAGSVNQAKVAGNILASLKTENNYQDTALVLANEDLLFPALESLPDEVKNVNITMGYPLKNTPLHSFWLLLFTLHEFASKQEDEKEKSIFYHKNIVQILNHQMIRNTEVEKLTQCIIRTNKIYIASSSLLRLIDELKIEDPLLKIIFSDWQGNPTIAIENMHLLIDLFRKRLEDVKAYKLEIEHLFYYAKVVQQIKQLNKEYNSIETIKTLKTIFIQLIGKEAIPFFGEPLKGLQLMGVLETRTLDFDTVILLSTNEGILPAGKSQNSFIPYDIKQKFQLPTHFEKDAIFAYHFYHLLQRSKKVFLLYSTESEGMGSSEKSRFITQILHELPKVNPKIKLLENQLSFDIPSNKSAEVEIIPNEEIKLKILDYASNRGFSPSALNTFVACSLDFYFKYVLKIRETKEVEETIEANTLGSFVHQVLENLYQEFLKKVLTVKDVKKLLPLVESEVLSVFKKEERFTEKEILNGKNLLIFKVAVKFVTNFLKEEILFLEKLEKSNQYLTILALEEELKWSFELNGKTIKLAGSADRVDKVGDVIRIVDYKTGIVNARDLKLFSLDEITEESKNSKAFQLLFYALLYHKMNEKLGYKIQSGNISFRKLSAGFLPVSVGGEMVLGKEILKKFELELISLITFILGEDLVFIHNKEAKFCKFCEV